MVIAITGLLVLGALAAVLVTQLDLGDDAKSGPTGRRATTTTTTTRPPTTTTSKPRGTVQYTVQQGDTLSAIARRFHTSTGAIVLANKLLTPDRLTVGQVLTIPPEVPIRLTVKPAKVAPGGSADLALSGAQPGERITFQIQTPTGSFTGPAHVAGADGTVTATYSVNATDPAGNYLVVARGDQGTSATAALVVGDAGSR
jgi:LysM repeat protein